jgi:ribosome biogenesis GTPase
MILSSLGWNDVLADAFQPFSVDGFVPARVALEHKHAYELLSPLGELTAECTGRLLHTARSRADLPAVGDWVAVRLRTASLGAAPNPADGADIHAVLPRRTCFSRRASGDQDVEQILAANIDTVFLVTGLDQNFNPRRIERYLAVTRASGAEPVVLLNKSDLHPSPAQAVATITALARDTPVVALSAAHGDGLDALARWLTPGRTIALLGSSGVGKSTLINRLLGTARQDTASVSAAVNKGRHTTTRRELIALSSGALVIDTPGMRELQLWDVDESALDATFADVAALVARCRFQDCTHRAEPGCAVRAALEDGTLDESRWQSYAKLQREQAYAARRVDPHLARAERDRWKKLLHNVRTRERFERELE